MSDRTINVGYVHVGRSRFPSGVREWECAESCPHPDHADEAALSGRSEGSDE